MAVVSSFNDKQQDDALIPRVRDVEEGLGAGRRRRREQAEVTAQIPREKRKRTDVDVEPGAVDFVRD